MTNNIGISMFNRLNSKPNMKEVYHKIRSHGTLGKSELVRLTNLKSGKINLILEELLCNKLIITAGLGRSTGGRKPIQYRINPTYGYVFGVDLSRAYAQLILSDIQMSIIDSHVWEMTEQMEPYYLFDQMVKTCEQMLEMYAIKKDKVFGVGIGVVGPLDSDNRVLIDAFGFPAPGWKDVKIADFFEEKLELPTVLDIGGSTALRAEYWGDIPNGYKNLVYFHIDTGLRSAIMSNGKIMSGAIGQMIIESDGIPPQNPFGNYGALHSYVTIRYIINQTKSRLKKGRSSIISKLINNIDGIQFSHLLEAINAGDPLIIELFTDAATYLGIGLANLINVLHPEKIILGGPLITKQDLFYKTAVEVAYKKTYDYYSSYTSFSKAKLSENSVGLGAAMMVLDNLYTF